MGSCCCCCGDGFKYQLRVRVKNAEGLPKMDFFSQSDGYVKITYEGTTRKTGVVNDSSHPVWNEILEFDNKKLGNPLLIRVYDHDPLSPDDYIGEAKLMEELPTDYNQVVDLEVPIKNKSDGADRGTIYITMEFTQEQA